MIRKLSAEDRGEAQRLSNQSPIHNLYLLGNMADLGFDSEICEFWGDFAEDGSLRGILNRYLAGWTAYGDPDADWAGLAQVMDTYPTPPQRLQDNPGGTASLLPYLNRAGKTEVSEQTLMKLESSAFRPADAREDVTVRRAESTDLESLVALYADAQHMSRPRVSVVRPFEAGRIWIAESPEQGIVSSALVNAETEAVSMIGGVYTPPPHRGCGYSRSVCSGLCADLLAAGKLPVLYWETPAAGKVYARLGFEVVGTWRAVRFL